MNLRRLAWRNFWFHRRALLGVALGALITAAILTGALATGDSVRYSLRQMALARLGKIDVALAPHERLFREKLVEEIGSELKTTVAPALILPGIAASPDGKQRANQVQVCGVNGTFWKLGDSENQIGDGVIVNARLAAQMNAKVGDQLVLRVEKPTFLGRDAPLARDEDSNAALVLEIKKILPDSGFGRFSLQANQVPPYNAFVDLQTLQNAVEQKGRANQILISGTSATTAASALKKHFSLADTGAQWKKISAQNVLELRTQRVFLDPVIADAAMARASARAVTTYFVNSIAVGSRSIPYSMVAGVEKAPLPAAKGREEIVLNEWAARDLGAKLNDQITIKYFVMGPRRKLIEKAAFFPLCDIVPLKGAALDPNLMPDFPGIAGAENCRDWEPGMSVNLDKIRPQDEKYWDAYKGTPKAFLHQDIAANLFKNRFGELTAVRYPISANQATLETEILRSVTPERLGLNFTPVREQALSAGAQGFDFGGLFIAFSFFLIVSALLLTGLLFALNAENRAREIGTLLALGFTPRVLKRLLLIEGFFVSLLGAIPGAFCGLLYTRLVLDGLNSVWQGATSTAELQFYAAPGSFLGGIVGAVLMALFSIWLVVRRQGVVPARVLLNGGSAEATDSAKRKGAGRGRILYPLSLVAAFILVFYGISLPAHSQAGLFFGAGFLLLFALCGWSYTLMAQPRAKLATDAKTVALRNVRRRLGRSLAVIILLSCASFLIAAVGAFRNDPQNDARLRERTSGTGGFALWAESSLPIYLDLNTNQARERFAFEGADSSFVPLRVRAGDDASCLNLNRAQTPQLWGVNPVDLQKRQAFGIDWTLLEKSEKNVVPAIGDENTIMWGLGKGVGSVLDYVDENGNAFPVKIVGLVKKTILQGALIINEKDFVQRFPSAGGYRAFLIDAGPGQATSENGGKLSEQLTQGLQDFGFEVAPAARRLALFQNVENTYLSIFQALGGLGLLLGSAGLGVVVLRNVLERRGELALLRAVGWKQSALQNLIFIEHATLAITGLGIGVAAGLIAIVPSLRQAHAPVVSLGLTLLAIALSALFWTYLATKVALRGDLIEALRNE